MGLFIVIAIFCGFLLWLILKLVGSLKRDFARRESIRTFEAQVAGQHVNGVWCRKGYNSLSPYTPPPEAIAPPTRQDTLWGDLKISMGTALESYNYYTKQSDMSLVCEARFYKGFQSLKPLDNILVEEYRKGDRTYHRVLQVERQGAIVYQDRLYLTDFPRY